MSGPDGTGLRILLVEDEPANRALVRAIIERAERRLGRVTLCEATTVAEARRVVAGVPVDLALIDVRLPDGNGLDLTAELRASEAPPAIAVLSASVLPAEQAIALAAGADEFFGKPFGAADLVDLVLRLTSREP